jgi:uncharacterized protein
MIPLRIGEPHKQCFAMYHPATVRSGERARGAVLLCNPFGQEAIRAHRLYKLIAERLAREGVDVMRFDYYGTGDSDGEDEDVTIEGCVESVIASHCELIGRTSADRTACFGLRLGAAIALAATGKMYSPLEKLLLWEPPLSGAAYLAELASAHQVATTRDYGARNLYDQSFMRLLDSESTHEALGFSITASMNKWLSGFELEPTSPSAAKNVIAFRENQSLPSGDSAGRRTEPIEWRTVPERVDWSANEMMNASVVPAQTLDAIVNCLLEPI